MGKKLDALLKRPSLRSAKFKPLVNLAVSRLLVLKNQRQARCNIAKSDLVQILKLGQHERAVLRVEHVIKEQSMLDVLTMIQGYIDLVLERFHLIEQEKSCPDELKEAISSLLYAASRCGEFPELQEIKAVFTAHYGKEFAARAIELRNNCGVNTKMIQKLSTRMPSLEIRMSVLKQIADENGITLHLEEPSTEMQTSTEPAVSQVVSSKFEDDGTEREKYLGTGKAKKYDNAADAAQAAFVSAAYAAEAARAAVELSRGDSHDPQSPKSPYPRRRKLSDQLEISGLETVTKGKEVLNVEENSSSFKEVHMEVQERQEATSSLKRSLSESDESTEHLTDSDAMDAPNPEDQVQVEFHTHKMEHSASFHDVLMGSTHEETDEQIEDQTESQSEAASTVVISMQHDTVGHAPEPSWIRRGWNSNKEKLKRPFAHRTRGVAAG